MSSGMRLTGLISGMDTESMVNELVKASSTKLDKAKQDKQLLEWKKEAWQGLNTKLYDFYKTEVSSLRLASTFKLKSATSSDESKVSIKAGSQAANGSHSVVVKQLASSAYLTGSNIKLSGNSYTTYSQASVTTNFADMTDDQGNSLALTGKSITIKAGNDTIAPLTFELGGTGENGVANLSELNSKLAETEGYKGLKASFLDGKLTFTNSTLKKNADGVETGEVFTIESEALGLSGDVEFKKDEDGKGNTLEGSVDLRVQKDFTSADITKSTKLSDIGIAVGTTFTIKGKDFVVDKDTKISDFTEGLSKLGVNANFDVNQGRFYINASATGEEYNFDITASDATALDILGLSASAGATKVDARDAIIEYNGVSYTGSSNTFELNGLTITAKGVTNGETIQATVASDTDGVYNSIKSFVKKYNEMVDELTKLYNEAKPKYDPLTDDERSKLSDTQIEQWEKEAKVGLLRRDETINNLLSSMRQILNTGIEVVDKDGNTKKYTLSTLGIVTGDYTENGKLHILGDADDPVYAGQTNTLKETLEKNPEIFSQIFAGSKENAGIGLQLYNSLNKAMSRSETSRSLTFYNDITLEKSIKEKDEDIDKWKEKLQKMEDKYYKQFTAMEKAMAEMQTQQSYLSSLMGGMSS